MLNTLIAALLLIAVHASNEAQKHTGVFSRQRKTLGASGPFPLLTSRTSVAVGGDLSVEVTFDECVDKIVTCSMFKSVPSVPCNCPTSAATKEQTHKCTFQLPALSFDQDYKFSFMAGQVKSTATGKANLASTTLVVTYATPYVGGILAALPPPAATGTAPAGVYEDTLIRYDYQHGGHLTLVDPTKIFLQTSGNLKKVTAILATTNGFHFHVEVNDGAAVSAQILKGAAVNIAGKTASDDSNMLKLTVNLPSPNCKQSSWSEWSTCDTDCNFFNGKFEFQQETKTRTRTVLQPAREGGTACGPASETTPCTTTLCALKTKGSRPFSGEHTGECSACKTGTEDSGCECGNGCEARGTCCQMWYKRNCCAGGCTAFNSQIYKGTFPLSCASNPNQCTQSTPKREGTSSYYCYCDFQCAQDQTCCGGTNAWIRECKIA